MADVLVRGLEDAVLERLKRRATREGVGLEEKLLRILREAARPSRRDKAELLAEMARYRAMTPPGPRMLAEDLIREDRDSR